MSGLYRLLWSSRIKANILVACILLLGVVVPHLVHAQTSSTLLPSGFQIIPSQCNCFSATNGGQASAAGWGCILQVFQNILKFVVFLTVLALTVFIALAGFEYMTSGSSSEKRSAANKKIVNAALGLFITLAAFLLVDSIMKVLYDPVNSQFGPWNAILSDANPTKDQCLKVQPNPPALPQLLGANNAQGGTGQGVQASSGTGSGTGSTNNRGQCTAQNLSGAFGNNAAAMSCVTTYEDTSCNPSQPSGTDIGADGNPVSFGLFQVNISANSLSQYPACESAVNNQPLNCTQAFSGGAYTASNHSTRVSNSSLYNTCVQAVSNPSCNEQVAQNLLNTKKSLAPWGSAAKNNCSSLLQ